MTNQNEMTMTKIDKNAYIKMLADNSEEIIKMGARRKLLNFAMYVKHDFVAMPFHRVYYEVLDRFAHGRIKKLIIQQPPQHGKALKVDTPILTTEGWKMHGDLQCGDYVFGADGKPKKVIQNFGIIDWHTVNLHFADGFTIRCADEHEWVCYVDRDNHKGRVQVKMEASDIFRHRNRRNPFIPADAVLQCETKELPIDPYLLGLWLGDGLSQGGSIISGEEDIEYYKTLDYWDAIYNTKDRYYRLHVEGLSRQLRLTGLIGNKHIPMDYLLASEEQRWELLRGLMDTDGCCDTRGRCEFCQKSGQLAEDVYVLIRSLGIKATINTYKSKLYSKDCGEKQRILFSPDKHQRVFKIERKQARLTNKSQADREDKKRFFITDVTRDDNCLVNCIQVEGGLYLAGKQLVPTHNSEGSSRLLPAFIEGLNPDAKICIGSYSTTIARDFNRDVQRIIDSDEYRQLFPNTYLNRSNVVTVSSNYLRNSEVIEMVGHRGSLRVVGRGGSLTSKTVDISILDDVYKDYAEGNSPVVRESAWKWYTTVVRTRLHNNSQELIVFTRWHEDDLIGRIEKSGEEIVTAETWEDIDNVPQGAWLRINFEALKQGNPTELDPREKGEALWESRHSREKLEAQQALDPVQFQCLFQGNPSSAEGRLYLPFKTYVDKDDWGQYIRTGCYVDVADEGSDYLFAVCYEIRKAPTQIWNEQKRRYEPLLFALVLDMEMTDESTEITTTTIPNLINRNNVQKVWVESNAGGSQFEKTISKKVRAFTQPFHQSGNKESRVLTASAMVNTQIIFPFGWETRHQKVYEHLRDFLRNFGANKHDDPEDALTGVYEKELADGNDRPYNQQHRGVIRRN